MVHLLGHQAWRHPTVQLCTVRVQLVAGLCASSLRGEGAECSVVLLSAPEMRRVCALYHPSSQGPTDVLSFPSGSPLPQMDDLGDVYLCPMSFRVLSLLHAGEGGERVGVQGGRE